MADGFVFGSFGLDVGIDLLLAHYLVHKEKRIRQHEELNIQTVNHDMKSPVGIAGTYLGLVDREGISGLTSQQQKNFRVAQEAIGRLEILVKKMSVKLVNERGLVLTMRYLNYRYWYRKYGEV